MRLGFANNRDVRAGFVLQRSANEGSVLYLAARSPSSKARSRQTVRQFFDCYRLMTAVCVATTWWAVLFPSTSSSTGGGAWPGFQTLTEDMIPTT